MNTGRTNDTYVLWGGALSLYTGKARSYLIKKGVPYREDFPTQPIYWERIVPSLGFMVVPVLEGPDGSVHQDTSEIIEHIDSVHPEPCFHPATPVQATVAALVGAFGSEGLLRAAMHYRWSYRSEQASFLEAEFGRCVSPSHDPGQRAAAAAPIMQAMNDHLPRLGVTADTIPAIEWSTEELLAILDAHFQQHPYILGGRPSLADFGLMAPLYAHLGRDPYPSSVMKRLAPNVFRWTERMNLAQVYDGEFPERSPEYPPDDAIPKTLEPLLALVFKDWGPELLANADQYNAWIAANPSLEPGDLASPQRARQLHPLLGEIRFTLRGRTIQERGRLQTLWHFDKVLRRARALTGVAKGQFEALVQRTGGTRVMAITLARPLRRESYVLVVG